MDILLQACAALENGGVPYLVIGALGLNLHATSHGLAVTTEDADLLLPADGSSLASALAALTEAGFRLSAGGEPLKIASALEAQAQTQMVDDLLRHGATVRAEKDDILVDLVLHAAGLRFDDLWPRASTRLVDGMPIRVAPLVDIVRSKIQAGRLKDLVFFASWKEQLIEMMRREGVDPPPGLGD